jgi:hypothetical protein
VAQEPGGPCFISRCVISIWLGEARIPAVRRCWQAMTASPGGTQMQMICVQRVVLPTLPVAARNRRSAWHCPAILAHGA